MFLLLMLSYFNFFSMHYPSRRTNKRLLHVVNFVILCMLCLLCYYIFICYSFNVLSCNVVLQVFIQLYLAEFNGKTQGKNGKFQLVERTPTEKYFFRKNHWKTPSWGRNNQWKIPVCVRILQCDFPLWLEESILEHVLTLSRRKKHFPCQEHFSPDTSMLWSGIQHSVL